MGLKQFLTCAALVAGAYAQSFATYTDSGRSLSVSIPEDTASSGSGSIYFQISAPKGTQWLAFGTGTSMSNANMFIIYSSGSNVVLSTRTASGHRMPTYDSDIKATVLSGSGVRSDGSMVVNVRCDNCLDSMSPTSSSSDWITAYKNGDSLGSTSTSASIQQHDKQATFSLDLTAGIGGSSSNPFVAAAASGSASTSTGASATGGATNTASATGGSRTTAVASGTSGVSQPVASQDGSSSSASTETSSGSSTDTLTSAHGIIMSILFLGAFPLFALTLYLPTANKVRFIHAPLQGLSVILLIVGMALGIVLGQKINQLDTYHQIIGFIVVFVLVIVQPTMGVLQHLHFHKTGGRSMWGPIHQNLGRAMIILGIINGGLGWQMAGNSGAYVPYAVVSVIIFVIYAAVVIWSMFRAKGRHSVPIDKENKPTNGYEMHNTHRRLESDHIHTTSVQPKTAHR